MDESVGEFFAKKAVSGRTTPKIHMPIIASRNSRENAHGQLQQHQQQRMLQGRRRQQPYQTNARRKEASRKRFPCQVASAVGVAVLIFLLALITARRAWTVRNGGSGSSSDGSPGGNHLGGMRGHDWSEFAATNSEAQLPNQDRKIPGEEPEVVIPAGTRSPFYGEIQRQRQRWLIGKAQKLRRQVDGGGGEEAAPGQSESGDPVDSFDTKVTVETQAAPAASAAAEQSHQATGVLKTDGPLTARGTPRPSGKISGKEEESESGKGSTNDSEEHRYVPGDSWTTQQGKQPRTTGETIQASSTNREARRKDAREVGSAARMERLSQLVAALGGNPGPSRPEAKQQEEGAKSIRVLPSASASAGSGAPQLAAAQHSNDKNRNARPGGDGGGSDARGADHRDNRSEHDRSRPEGRRQSTNRRNAKGVAPLVPPEPHEGRKQEQKPDGNGRTASLGRQETGSSGVKGPDGVMVPQALEGGRATMEERIARIEDGAELWGSTYAPAIEPGRRQELIEKWSPPGGSEGGQGTEKSDKAKGGSKGRILLVVSSIDRGQRLGRKFRNLDKMNYVLMMMDEMREACEVGFSPQVHFITAWDTTEVADLIRDRLFCERTGAYVPYSHEEHPPDIGNNLALKHRVYMKSRLNQHDVFVQLEDDMIVTLNHILLYLEHSHKLAYRSGGGNPNFSVMPGFIRVEPGKGMGARGIGEEWFEWEILLSRFKGMKITGAGTYMGLDASRVLRRGGNNQGMWMLTQDQLSHLSQKCKFLRYSEASKNGNVETHSGSMEIFQTCNIVKVFPATEFEGFLIHHRTNNKNGQRGESIPAVPISMLRVWAEQFLRDSAYMLSYN